MKIKEYIESLQEIMEVHPNLEVIFASDDEGNSFEKVVYKPSVGHFDENHNFIPCTKVRINSVCLN